MTLRAFILGVMAVALIAAVAPYNDFQYNNTYLTGCHFPPGPFFILLFLTLGANLALKLVRRRWALRQAELMLVWCMMIVASTVPSSGLMRFLFSLPAAPAYYAEAPELPNQARVLEAVPDSLVLTKDPRSPAVKLFFEGRRSGEEARLYLRLWARPLMAWAAFIACFYMAAFFLMGLLRKQWVDSERLIFPIARVPLELTEGSEEPALLPQLVRNHAFLVGAAVTLAFAAVRMAPALIQKGAAGWRPELPVDEFLSGTPLGQMQFWQAPFYPLVMGVAFLVPADVALSIWFFYVFARCEMQVAYWVGTPMEGGPFGPFMGWQQTGSFLVFALMMFWAARRHLADVVRKALGLGRRVDDSAEPYGYAVSFWGFVLAVAGMAAWFAFFGMNLLTAFALIALILVGVLIHARLVSQGGIFFTQQTWAPATFLHSITGGHAFSAPAAVVAQMQNAILVADSRETLSPHAMNALRISSAFEKGRRLLLPIMLVSILVAAGVCLFSSLDMYYTVGGLNIGNNWGTLWLPRDTMNMAGRMIVEPGKSAEPHWGAFGLGAAIMFVVTVLRARFYWWPMHSLGFLSASTWPAYNLWLSFFLAWLLKVATLRLAGGSVLRWLRNFFLGVIVAEALAIAVSTVLGLTAGIKLGHIFLPT